MVLENLSTEFEDSPFYLKRKGDLVGAIRSYADRFADAQVKGDEYLSELCFEQIFDIHLLEYFKEQVRFDTQSELRRELERDIASLLQRSESYDEESFKRYFASCWRRLVPRGRGQSPFSVDRQVLLDHRQSSKAER